MYHNKNDGLKYYIQPTFIDSVVQYQNVNIDPNLRRLITEFFLKKSIKWIKNYKEFENAKNILPKLESSSGYKIIYKLLKKFAKGSDTNWYDMKQKYSIIKDYLRYKLKGLSSS